MSRIRSTRRVRLAVLVVLSAGLVLGMVQLVRSFAERGEYVPVALTAANLREVESLLGTQLPPSVTVLNMMLVYDSMTSIIVFRAVSTGPPDPAWETRGGLV